MLQLSNTSPSIHILAVLLGAFPRAVRCYWMYQPPLDKLCCNLFYLKSGVDAAIPE